VIVAIMASQLLVSHPPILLQHKAVKSAIPP
jgi:hypothetical protein